MIWDSEPLLFDFCEDIQYYFTHGQCPALAYEIHKLKGWTLAMLSSEPVGSPDYMGHVFVIDSDAYAIDIKGRRSLEDIKDEWWFAHHLHRFNSLKEFEYEMLDWELKPKFNKDKQAKLYAARIIELLD